MDNLSTTSYTISATLGETRKFKIKAKNIFDYGPFSSEVTVICLDAPIKMDPPVVSIPVGTKTVKFEWDDVDNSTNGDIL